MFSFFWGPIVDLTMTPRRWYLLAVVVAAITLFSLGNIPIAYMTAFDGSVHDRYGGGWMLNGEALLALVCVAAGLLVLHRINAPRARAVLP
jgi:hypothetical protein